MSKRSAEVDEQTAALKAGDKNFFFRKFWQQRGSGAKPIVV
jgi:hypothetical protein